MFDNTIGSEVDGRPSLAVDDNEQQRVVEGHLGVTVGDWHYPRTSDTHRGEA